MSFFLRQCQANSASLLVPGLVTKPFLPPVYALLDGCIGFSIGQQHLVQVSNEQ
jgi:hypothetical protein